MCSKYETSEEFHDAADDLMDFLDDERTANDLHPNVAKQSLKFSTVS